MPMRRLDRAASSASLPAYRGVVLTLAAGLVALQMTGCAWWDHLMHGNEVQVHAISLHHFAEAGTDVSNMTQMAIDASGSRRVCITRTPIISNRQIMGARLESGSDPERPALRLLLDRQGAILWLQACQEAPGDRVAVMLDGFFWYAMKLPRPIDTHSILLDGPIGKKEAQTIVDSIPGHYRRLNPSAGLF